MVEKARNIRLHRAGAVFRLQPWILRRMPDEGDDMTLKNPLDLSTMQAAKQAGISDARIRQMINSEKVQAIKIGSSWMIHVDDVAAMLERKDGRMKEEGMKKQLQDEYVQKMQGCVDNGDTEVAHGDADDLLCELLRKLGYNEVVARYYDVKKWYA